ncbi:cyclic nucleotide-binding domain-containing protein [Silvanigrella paludirubra]|jgi:CRP-like cAMP-binding protein|uniref:Cyclic nucleotide-binding domain-containing protein n=1 Tax=Silvanigrella paludirubra TaxID=2499159 RepID=A0A6N6VSW6_9BACT|nr:Crp/Fnr family transcriptional regulator [Silvanigrella paludirubra]KAB8039217.1 cyclic nucleotide-binding domain-containing protein [Silvanigrella paludirubra]MBX9837796.1 Crp/Fnr family transcriptional regulator [Silvanigrellaceae bacterium]
MERKTKGTYTLRRLFPSLSEEDLLRFQENSSVIRLKKGQNLFISGDTPRSIYGVANGCLKIVRESQEGESVITRIVRAGQIVGIREVFGEFKYGRTSVALKDSEVFSIEKTIVLDLIQRSPAVSLQFMKIFCNELSRLEKRIESDLYRPAKNRVASVIFELFNLFADEGAQNFEPPLNRRDIAELADVTPETVSRAIADFKQAGIMETHGSSFTILDTISLQNEAEER